MKFAQPVGAPVNMVSLDWKRSGPSGILSNADTYIQMAVLNRFNVVQLSDTSICTCVQMIVLRQILSNDASDA